MATLKWSNKVLASRPPVQEVQKARSDPLRTFSSEGLKNEIDGEAYQLNLSDIMTKAIERVSAVFEQSGGKPLSDDLVRHIVKNRLETEDDVKLWESQWVDFLSKR